MSGVIEKEGYCLQQNPNGGPTLGYSKTSGLTLKQKDGLYFKNFSHSDELLPYEDWRLSPEERATDLANRLSIEEIAGLMLYSAHQAVPGRGFPFPGTYNGKSFDESGKQPSDLSDEQLKFLKEDGIRHVLMTTYDTPAVAARWNNNMQSLCEGIGHGIPVNTSSDPRHGSIQDSAEFRTASDTSKWPEGLAMAATFDPKLCKQFAQTVQTEYRSLGIATALHPQADLAAEPRWMRSIDTFGSSPELARDMTKAYCEGLQETDTAPDKGWGNKSVIGMVKHWPGGGPCESGRDAHYVFGKYAVYPGKCLDKHLLPFVDGAFKLDDGTKQAGAVMPYYTVSCGVDPDEKVGNSYSYYIIQKMLREKYGYDGVVCTDWGITQNPGKTASEFGSRCYGVENLSEAERHLKIIMNGVDQFGGNNDAKPIIEAYKIGCERYGKDKVEKRFRESAKRLLRGSFRVGLFENPYVDPEESTKVVGAKHLFELGYKAQLKAVVLLKNHSNTLPLKLSSNKPKVYIPIREVGPVCGFFRNMEPAYSRAPVTKAIVEKYFTQVDKPEDADFAIVFTEAPITNPYELSDVEKGGNGYFPISLQYRPYTATTAREVSLEGGDPLEKTTNRSYKGKTVHCSNEKDLDNILETRKRIGNKPLIVVCTMSRPVIPAEFDAQTDVFIANFGVSPEAIFDTVVGKNDPSGLLPIQVPKSMEVVEAHCEDKPFDMDPYVDTDGNVYDFGFGLSYSGPIHDERTKVYHK